jgi:hypothetical protein
MRYLFCFYNGAIKEQVMTVKIVSEDGQKLTLQVTVDISGSMLEAEEKIMAACNALGSLSTEKALTHFDTDGTSLQMGQKKIYGKNQGK